MNKRINELMDECGLWIDYDNREVTKGELEFFAEQIVRECARAVDRVYETAEPDYGCLDWSTWAYGTDVLKHFGMEP